MFSRITLDTQYKITRKIYYLSKKGKLESKHNKIRS